mmetsp:Transcript_30066/g.54835  ORF Transcript_30066/g.54835 Transcript_30066/m.54835 type:complete len:303 (-) Transcript_30066:89-997(-)
MAALQVEQEAGQEYTIFPKVCTPGQDKRYMTTKMDFESGDVCICGYLKSGTNWMQQIVYQIMHKADTGFASIRDVVPPTDSTWINVTDEDMLKCWGALERPRACKLHFCPPAFHPRHEVKYIVVYRSVFDIPASLHHMNNAFTDEVRAFYGLPLQDELAQTFDNYEDFKHVFLHLRAWLPYYHQPNVLFVHFTDMVKKREEMIRRLAAFLGVDMSDQQLLDKVMTHTSLEWMQANGDKFDRGPLGAELMKPAAFVRSGKVGANARELTPALRARLERCIEEHCPTAWREWMVSGGELPCVAE